LLAKQITEKELKKGKIKQTEIRKNLTCRPRRRPRRPSPPGLFCRLPRARAHSCVPGMPPRRRGSSQPPLCLHLDAETSGERPSPHFPPPRPLFVLPAKKSRRRRNPSRARPCPEVATEPFKPRRRVNQPRRRRLHRSPASIELEPLGIRRQHRVPVAGHRNFGVELSFTRDFSGTDKASIMLG